MKSPGATIVVSRQIFATLPHRSRTLATMPRQPLTRAELDALAAYLQPALRRLGRVYDRLTARGARDAGQPDLWLAAKEAADAACRLSNRAGLTTAADEPTPGPAMGDPVPRPDGPGGQHVPPPVAVADGPPADGAAYEQIRAAAARAMKGRRHRH